jgi:hypothetical protein
MASPSMNNLAERYAPQELGSVLIYTHEAHPGEIYPHLTSMEQKTRHAEALRDQLGVSRQIYLDALDGACHRAYGSMPNMTWIFNRAGLTVYKSNWTHHTSVENALEYFTAVSQRRKSGERLVPFQVERLDYRENDREGFLAGLTRNGPKAVEEFKATFK